MDIARQGKVQDNQYYLTFITQHSHLPTHPSLVVSPQKLLLVEILTLMAEMLLMHVQLQGTRPHMLHRW